MRTWLANASLVLPDRVIQRSAIRIEDGHIAEIEERPNGITPDAINLHGMTLIPGIIDMHGDMLEREIEPRPKAYLPYALALHELDKRLAACGVTTAYAAISFSEISIMRNTLRREDIGREIVRAIHAERPNLLVDMRAHARFEVTNANAATMLRSLFYERQVDLVSLNDHTPGQGQYRNIENYIKQMAEWRNISADYAEVTTREHIEQARNRPIAWEIISDVARLARGQGVPIASHDDDTAEKVALMREMGATISEFPVSLEAARAARAAGMYVAMGAPNALRGVSTSGNLSARTAIEVGVTNMLAADYHPGTLIQAAWLLARSGLLPLTEAVKLISTNVAAATNLRDRGAIVPGLRADLVLVDASDEMPRVRATLREGHVIYADRHSGLATQRSAVERVRHA